MACIVNSTLFNPLIFIFILFIYIKLMLTLKYYYILNNNSLIIRELNKHTEYSIDDIQKELMVEEKAYFLLKNIYLKQALLK